MITELQTKNIDVYMNVNNHYEGSAPLTIDKLKGLLQKKQMLLQILLIITIDYNIHGIEHRYKCCFKNAEPVFFHS